MMDGQSLSLFPNLVHVSGMILYCKHCLLDEAGRSVNAFAQGDISLQATAYRPLVVMWCAVA
jgi:hypothetical protein